MHTQERSSFGTHIRSMLLLLMIALFMLGANPFKSQTVAPMDLLLKYPGWQNTGFHIPLVHGERSDILDGKLPIWLAAKHEIKQGEIPYWNYVRGGKPGLNFTNALFTPAFFTFALFENDAAGFYAANLVNVLIGLLGMYLFLSLFFRPSASIFGAVIFMFSGFNTAWFYWIHINTAVWTPWVLLSVYRYLDTGKRIYLPLVTLSMLMLNLGGFPMIAVMTYIALAFMVFGYLFTRRIPLSNAFSMLLYLALFSILGVVIALPFIYPLVELLHWSGGMGHRKTGSGFHLYDLKLFFNPDLYRYPHVETTFYVGILPLLALPAALYFYIRKPRFIAAFGMVLFLFAVSIAFTVIPLETIRKIPLLNSSLLTRFGYLIDLSLAIIAAYAFHELTRRIKTKKWVYLLIVLLLGVQIADQKRLFSRFNAVVPDDAFYASTKTLRYVQQHIKPFEYVIADRGYLIAGTLGGYGLKDWFAHSFHTAGEKETLSQLVNHPFQTPTSAMFSCDAIRLESPYMDLLNIRYILCTAPIDLDENHALWDIDQDQTPAPNMPTNSLTQQFYLSHPETIDTIKLLMATYGAKHAAADVTLTLKKDNSTIASSTVSKEQIADNEWVRFRFSPQLHLQEGNYTIALNMHGDQNQPPLTVWTTTQAEGLYVNGKATKAAMKMLLAKDGNLTERYRLLDLEPHIHLIENRHVQGDAYFLPSLGTDTVPEYHTVVTKRTANDSVTIHYNGSAAGWVILPMRKYPGWHVYVNGQEREAATFINMLPAVHVDGPAEIIFSYHPKYASYMYGLSLMGLLVLLISMLQFRRKG